MGKKNRFEKGVSPSSVSGTSVPSNRVQVIWPCYDNATNSPLVVLWRRVQLTTSEHRSEDRICSAFADLSLLNPFGNTYFYLNAQLPVGGHDTAHSHSQARMCVYASAKQFSKSRKEVAGFLFQVSQWHKIPITTGVSMWTAIRGKQSCSCQSSGAAEPACLCLGD
jgi:hypothetical protein